jgi:putative MATE family efflux protein
VIVGRFVSKDALAAVSGCTPVMSIIMLFMVGLSSGSTVIVAQRTGAKNREALQKAISTIACLTLMCSVFITVVGLIICKPLLVVLGTPTEIINDSYRYLIIIYLGTTGNLVYQMGNGVLQGMGDSIFPFLFLLFCSGLNIVLDLFTVLVLGWGVAGAAIATAVSQLVSGIGVLYRLNHGNYGVKITFKNIYLDKQETKSIIAIGLPAAIQNVGNSIAALCVQSSVNFFGASFMAANSIVTKVDDLVMIPVMALSTALCTFVAQNMGTFKMERIKKGVNSCILCLIVVGVGLCGIIILFRGVFPMLFTLDPEVINYASQGLFIMSFMCIFYGIDRCLVNAMRGAGKAVVPMITAQFGVFFRIPLAYYLGVYLNDYHGIFYAMLIAVFLRMAAIAVYYYCGGWKHAIAKFEKAHGKA